MKSPASNHGLSSAQLGILLDVLAPFASRIERVSLFGSRAQGKARPNSDIDIVLHGDVEGGVVDRLATLFDASGLPVKVDVVGYSLIAYEPLKRHIDEVEKVLFKQQDLLARRLEIAVMK